MPGWNVNGVPPAARLAISSPIVVPAQSPGLSRKSQRLRVALDRRGSGWSSRSALGIPQASILRVLPWFMCCRCSCRLLLGAPARPAPWIWRRCYRRGGRHHPSVACWGGTSRIFYWFVTFLPGSSKGEYIPACSVWYSIPATSPERRSLFLAPSPPFWCRGPARTRRYFWCPPTKIGRRPGYPVKSCPSYPTLTFNFE